MAADRFEVDLAVLSEVAVSTADALAQKRDTDLEDVLVGEDDLGHGQLYDALRRFNDLWEWAVNTLTDDVSQISATLGQVVGEYASFNETAADEMKVFADACSGLDSSSLLSQGLQP